MKIKQINNGSKYSIYKLKTIIVNVDNKFILKVLYQAIKNAIGAAGAILFANLLGLNFALSAGIIVILSLLDSRKETIRIGIKRIITGLTALVIASFLFVIFGYHIFVLSIFILIITFIAYLTSSSFSVASSLVLAGHIYQTQSLNSAIFFNEVFILLIGVVVGFLLTLHMPDEEKYLKRGIEYVENQYKNHLIAMANSLKNLCLVDENVYSLNAIEKQIKEYRAAAGRYKNNALFTDRFDYDHYFKMRLEQVYRLIHMKEKLKIIFVSHHEAEKLSEFTQMISSRFSAHTQVDDLLQLTAQYDEYFKKRPLPKTRSEFECRATLFQYLIEMDEFIRIKARYIENQK